MYYSYTMPLPIITEIKSRDNFLNRIKTNPGLFIVKFGAEWCAPCKQIEEEVLQKFNSMPDNVQCAIIDIDDNFDVYAFLKTKKLVSGIPAILCYHKDNDSYIPDDSCCGSDKKNLHLFFERCISML
jgi:thiol-disulfide isomerase/thioredoxin